MISTTSAVDLAGPYMTKKFLRYRFEISHTFFFHQEAGHLSETSISDSYNIQLPYKPNDQTQVLVWKIFYFDNVSSRNSA